MQRLILSPRTVPNVSVYGLDHHFQGQWLDVDPESGRHTDLVGQYKKNVCQMFADSIS